MKHSTCLLHSASGLLDNIWSFIFHLIYFILLFKCFTFYLNYFSHIILNYGFFFFLSFPSVFVNLNMFLSSYIKVKFWNFLHYFSIYDFEQPSICVWKAVFNMKFIFSRRSMIEKHFGQFILSMCTSTADGKPSGDKCETCFATMIRRVLKWENPVDHYTHFPCQIACVNKSKQRPKTIIWQ